MATPIQLSQRARASMITCGSGEEVYSLFGHTAIRIKDDSLRMDLVYNYGTFDFNTPNFYLKFAQGKLKYFLSVAAYHDFLSGYIYENREVKEQILNFTPSETQKLFDLLEENLLPANKFYAYDFFLDNCSTRARDIIAKATDNKIQWNFIHFQEQLTFRQLIDPYLKNSPWADFGIDLGLALPTDRLAKPYEYAFLPEKLFLMMQDANYKEVSLVKKTRTPFKAKQLNNLQPTNLLSPVVIFYGLLLVGVLIAFIPIKQVNNIFDIFILTLMGVLGLVILLLWFATDHTATQYNLNILWANPLCLASFTLIKRKSFLYVMGSALIIYFILFVVKFHFFNIFFLPLLLLMLTIFIKRIFIKKYIA